MEGILNSLRLLINKMKLSIIEAMDFMEIPEKDRASYREAIEGNGTLKVDEDETEETEEEDDDLMFIP